MKTEVMRQRNIGVNFRNRLAEVVIWAPNAERVTLVLEQSEIEMVREDMGYWRLLTPELKPGMSYHIGLDGKQFSGYLFVATA
jgi:maltooligosyltrehalose trehalohydrolase